ncbi:long-chain fatty acid--CoA ligase [Erythrobacter litoralis]|uniref:class I adenylate-forming enzyme family protein n=1 Tax=Erythrobacter litoralis TaxID=39960 RepID=UPI002434A755|nr:class I adenylate-forming enzyme family protein [Erythrobacter litoralis]MDG6079843.1 long-chain fatty acid--CoA ligase [Erythrobacter litoralis]
MMERRMGESVETGDALALYRACAAKLTAQGSPFAVKQPGTAKTRHFAGTKQALLDIADASEERFGPRAFFEIEDIRKSYAKVMEESRKLAASLSETHRIREGEVVGVAMRNSAHWFTAFWAIQRLGAVAALLNSRSKGPEIAASAADVGARLIFADERCAERLDDETEIPVIGFPQIGDLIEAGEANHIDVRATGDDPAMILFTSGTTGRPKGATISHANICNAARQLEYIGELGMTMAAERRGISVELIRQHAPPVSPLLIVPMFHISGVTQMISTMQGGGVLAGMRRWDPAVAIDLIERNKVTQVSGPSLVMADLLAQPNAAERMKSVTSMVVAGQASPIALTKRIYKEFPQAGQAAGWGMTELTGTVASCSGPVFAENPGKVGVPLPLVDIEVRRSDGSPADVGEVGELVVRGPTVMSGYWGLDEATAKTFDGEWLLTGDLGTVDERGMLAIVDRAKDMVISAGENIYCAEVERVLAMVDHHHEVALFGIPDERLGERAIAAIVLVDGCVMSPDPEAVKNHAREHLADYKVPTEIVFDLGPLPRNVTGKVDKAALKRLYEERHAEQAA